MSKFKEFVLITFAIFILLVLIYGIAFFDKGITGKVSLELEPIYEKSQILEGILKISLKEGELIPSDSKIIFENAGENYEYDLNEIVSEELISGNFYIEEANLSGNGDGFGVKGEKIIYPKVYFELKILLVDSNETEDLNASEEIISGEVFANTDFSYNLKTEVSAELVSGSVKIDSGDLDNSEINLVIEGTKVIVTTNYSEKEEGFGSEYLGENTKILSINLSNLGFIGKAGELKISLIHGNEEIVIFSTILSSETNPEIVPEEKDKNSNTFYESQTQEVNEGLSEEENNILINEFGNQSVKVTNAEKTPEDIIVRFEIENYWVEHHYDSLISDESLKLKIEEERIRFLKDLANKFLEEEIIR